MRKYDSHQFSYNPASGRVRILDSYFEEDEKNSGLKFRAGEETAIIGKNQEYHVFVIRSSYDHELYLINESKQGEEWELIDPRQGGMRLAGTTFQIAKITDRTEQCNEISRNLDGQVCKLYNIYIGQSLNMQFEADGYKLDSSKDKIVDVTDDEIDTRLGKMKALRVTTRDKVWYFVPLVRARGVTAI